MKKLMCYVGLNPVGGSNTSNGIAETEKPHGGGIAVFEVGLDGCSLNYLESVPFPVKAGALFYARETQTLYAVDEKKTNGRGELSRGSSVYAYRVDPQSGRLTYLNHVPSMGPNPADVTVIPEKKVLYTASHGGFEHIEKIVQNADGSFGLVYEYDDAATAQYALNDDGSIGAVTDVAVHTGHGMDPNPSPQHQGHAQSGSHAHCTVIDPDKNFLLVGDKGTDRIYVYRVGEKLSTAFVYQFPEFCGARHIAFDPVTGRVYCTLEFSSELASFDFDKKTGALREIDRISTVAPDFTGRNEPATLRVHPNGGYIYVNNRGEDTIVTICVDSDGHLTRKHAFSLGKSTDPGTATRQMELTPDASYLFVPERPAYQIRILQIHTDGTLSDVNRVPIENPVFICFAEL
ncbi:MAG: beta-propeller fold lactonase family protein [Lachnospiraceae bacterium]|nr:beta-propeller fold lactonase family protein [Lachnospiraceae bacterium]